MGRIVPEADVDRMVSLYRSGLSIAQVSRTVFWSPTCVYNNLLVRGVPMRRRGGGSNHPRKLASHHVALTVDLYRRGYSMSEVGEIMGLAPTTVKYRLGQAGEPIRTAGQSMRLRSRRRRRVAAA